MIENINLEEIQRKCQHGLSDEQWIDCKNSFPYPDMRGAMRIACNQAIDLCIQEQQKAYKEIGYTNTGEKIGKLINEVKKLII